MVYTDLFELFVWKENNVRACLPLDFTQEQYDDEDRKYENILQTHTHDIKPIDKPSNMSLFASGWWWHWRSPSVCLV